MLPYVLMAVLMGSLAQEGQRAGEGDTFEWPQIERQIQWHHERVRACGPLSAIHALQLLGHDVDAAAILAATTGQDDRGTQLADVLRLCREFESHARMVRLPKKTWRRLEYPCILIVNEGHHAVVLRSLSIPNGTARVWDPSTLKVRTLPLSQLRRLWTGDAIMFHAFPWPSLILGVANVLILSALLVRQWRRWKRGRRGAIHG
jgi:hypothetical protein